MDDAVLATIAANLENRFKEISAPNDGKYDFDITFTVEGSNNQYNYEFTVRDVLSFDNGNGQYAKAVVLTDGAGNLYIHYNGTGDGNWGYNSVAMGGGPSDIQTASLEFLNNAIEKYYGESSGKVYVSGHSQGGNNAQYAIMNSEYGSYIDTCIAMDAPGFSHEMVQQMKDLYGEDYYERQRDKIYSYNGESDFVDVLGLEIIAPQDKDHLRIIDCPDDASVFDYHFIQGMMDRTSLNPRVDDYTAFHYLVEGLNKKIADCPHLTDEEKCRIGQLAMHIAEYFVGNEAHIYGEITQQDIADLLKYLIPLATEYREENPEIFRNALAMLNLSPETIQMIEKLLSEFDELSETRKEKILDGIGKCIEISGEGKIQFSGDYLALILAIFRVLPVAVESSGDIYAFLDYIGLTDKLKDAILDNPGFAALIIVLIIMNSDTIIRTATVAASVILVSYLVDILYKCIEDTAQLAEQIRKFFINTLQSIKETLERVKQFIRSLTSGHKYASVQPYFRVDPALLREYARRLSAVNSRIMSLDRDMNDLYWQVGLFDILDIIQTNILTGYSMRLRAAHEYLNTAAEKLEDADRLALSYLGG